ncbi:Tfp pilus assembly protein PilP [Clostridium saccharoperbutylacetonicum]|jgi:hypothetical protein|uniref:Lipoprotein n=1 Tax=Clostridium saccharoperbutylacetonicum N1-4(HMT) TaxID=931276 RepID=M1MWH8_9CLOT|nr:hypothetical protein Cspa_c52000 [Clostridium saccharoperbutylacetonicum N1-4(HMT)]AQR97623.1 hypothetical protein CLSAP_49480 [Clostridium saccharoperbutylacetonicum]NRT60263.1 Tfp pilus assembly protein PilP [Clostridium saccharoperbutylacetonicum]NSB23575.1 Tfp pilus assembly protein PilP [Clostridium saccharoperbutylacetonicum]NSB33508.1 Tfp pilus assembly protein PilP [Clostridium saccharoperbutylacetonicum]
MLGIVILLCLVLVACNAFYDTDTTQQNMTEIKSKSNK